MKNTRNWLKGLAFAFIAVSTSSYANQIIPGGNSWVDSYSVGGKCYCASSYDHGIGSFTVNTPAGVKTVVEVCEAIGPGPGRGNNPGYNTVQCGHDPAHSDEGNFNYTDGSKRRVADEIECPGRVDIGPNGCDDIGPKWDLSIFGTDNTPTSSSGLVHITKRNAKSYAFDGNKGGANGQDLYLWPENDNNVNQQWIEIDRGNGFYSYQKVGTNFCIDGNRGGARNQSVYLWQCSTNNQNQHWFKESQGGGSFKLVKRNSAGYAINGGNGGAPARSVNLWDSKSDSQNLHWIITPID